VISCSIWLIGFSREGGGFLVEWFLIAMRGIGCCAFIVSLEICYGLRFWFGLLD
jgi:hypothetical protein